MPVSSIIYKGRLKRRLDPRYFCEVYVASKLAFVFGFKVELLDLVSIDHHDAGFLRVGGIDKHLFCHLIPLHNLLRRSTPGGAPLRNMCLV